MDTYNKQQKHMATASLGALENQNTMTYTWHLLLVTKVHSKSIDEVHQNCTISLLHSNTVLQGGLHFYMDLQKRRHFERAVDPRLGHSPQMETQDTWQ